MNNPGFNRIRICALVLGMALVLAMGATAETAKTTPTFTKDIAPIFQAKCESCHRPTSIAPMPLITYQQVRPWVAAIEAAVATREMPPWHIDKTVGIQEFKNDRSLSDEQLQTILDWVEAGAPRGNLDDMPPPVSWPDGETWMFAELFDEPDLVIQSPPYTMPASAQDVWFRPVVDTGLTEERWVRAIEIRPSTVEGRRVIHHALARLQQEEADDSARSNIPDETGPGLFMEWAVGKQGELMRPNSGKLMKPGSKIHWDIHIHAVGEEITTQAELALYFYPKGEEPKYRQRLGIYHAIAGGPRGLDIPPNEVAVHQGFKVMESAGRIENFQPHMHLRGKGMMMEAVLPSGERRVLSHVNNFQFDWHNNYVYADHVAPLLPKGTVLNFTAWHDNTKANRSNPDPNQWVGWGDRTVDEMAHAWVNITYLSDEEYQAELQKREALSAANPTEDQPEP
jgi:hypothetical protein